MASNGAPVRDAEAAATKKYSTPALEKGLDVLELLSRESEGLTKSQLARRLDRTVSEIFRMLLCLEERGYIAQAAGEHYVLTAKLYRLAHEHPPTERLMAKALPVMKRLADTTGQSCHLAVPDREKVVILTQVNSSATVGFYVKLGTGVDIMEASSGYVVLAFQSDEESARMVSEWQRTTRRKPPADLQEHLKRIRKAGFEERSSYQVKGVVNISFPVCDLNGSALGALTIPYIEYNVGLKKRAEVVAALGRAALEISEEIGSKPAAR